jgi:geranylgeranyl pyrophosphate synthase
VPVRLVYPNDKKLFESCRNFGVNLGTAFQMVDDVIDFEKAGEKDYAKDVKEGLVNFVMAELLHQNPHLRSKIASCLGAPQFEVPWTQGELSKAVDVIREKSGLYLEKAQHEFNFIKTYSDAASPEVLESIGAIELLLEFLKVRQN